MKTAIFRLDDNINGLPGLARVEVIAPAGAILGRKLWKIRILDIIRPSVVTKCYKVGKVCPRVWEGLLEFEQP